MSSFKFTPNLAPLVLTIIGALVFSASATVASETSEFRCNLGGEFAFISIVPEEGRAILQTAIETHPLTPLKENLYANDREEISFEPHGDIPTLWMGDVSFPCERVHASTQNHATGAVGGNETPLNVAGQSLGGKMRGGPGTNFSQTGSIAEGTWLTILANTGIRFDGYDWFEVSLDNGARGYQWGGIMCSNGQKVAGIFEQCGARQNASTSQPTSTNDGWMAFAIGDNGKFGHGAGSTVQQAEQYALQYCGEVGCQIADVTNAQCHALASVPGGVWFGAAQNKLQAEDYAMGFCSAAAGNSCRIEYSYCR